MIRRKKKAYYVKKDVAKATPYDPMHSYQSINDSKYSKSDSVGGHSALRKLLYLALLLFVFWFIKECFLSINIFQ
ncbi:MAG: hypothetical protein R3Y46_06810 [Opitutales bacterium]